VDRAIEPDLSVIVPTVNEAENLAVVIPELQEVLDRIPGDHEIIVVDGGSVDDTVAVARDLRPDVVVVQQTRTGKGNALAVGFEACTGDAIVMIDADGSTDPAEIHRFVEALVSGAEFAKGSRFAPTGGSSDITLARQVGNKMLNALVNILYGTRYSDLCYGYNAFWARCVPHFSLDTTTPRPAGDGRLWGDGFEIETLLNLRAARANLRVIEVPSFEHPRIHGVSNLNAVKDGFRVLRTIAREGRRRSDVVTVPAAPWSGSRSLTGIDK
jgi:glycosyltransferase involved in cell wall biosynthesis